ncbi:HGTP_anticodon domain-containing protein/tRNA-synt_His domain-containing protein [Cephalotus follicularis]|uniref:Histidine--tRNA ligase, cytoplasmic n=1 Tax=Cephalotus follicularis TaxID=3775 RepID=A0A1Q3CFS1_CEPFO|nr:HGTP_anticodon domain-containing protein/tRNA-synt_His domain-containing protein [Cephalotus follicularis]
MAERKVKTITIGGKGSSLSSSSVFAISTGNARVRIDSSALDKLSDQCPALVKSRFPVPKTLNLEETRASLTVLLNKLLVASSASSNKIRTDLPVLISKALNSQNALDFPETLDVTEEERFVLEESSPAVHGICAILDHLSTALMAVVDVFAALSCEALGAHVRAFSSLDSGDGFADKEANGVASDLKVLLTGSNLVGKVDIKGISKIPETNGRLREAVKLMHSTTRVKLNSSVMLEEGSSDDESVGTTVISLAVALRNLGKSSLCRGKMNLESIDVENLSNSLMGLFEKGCPNEEMVEKGLKFVTEAVLKNDYVKFVQEVNVLLGIVWKIVAWEAVTAFVALDGKGEEAVVVDGGDVKVDKKTDKKKKKVSRGKGTGVIVQLTKDTLQSKVGDNLEKWIEDLLLFLDPKDPEFDTLLKKVKEIVESNERRRLPKVPKGTRDFAKEQMVIRERAFSIIKNVFKRHGATALDTPTFELRETLMGKYGEDSKLIYDLADQGGELCSLRYDLTVPFARYVAMNGITSFKRYQIASVFRRDNPSKGRYREFFQCDFDIAGTYEKMGPDFEVVYVLTELLDELNIGDYEIKLNHRMLLDGMLEICGVPPEKFRTICSSIDKLDKQTFEQVKKEMVEEKGLPVETADRIGTFVKEKGSPLKLLSRLKQDGSEFMENDASNQALGELEILFQALEKSKCINKVVFDLSLARGLDYYTGVIFEAVFKGATQVGSIAAGGRYDNLIGMFGTKQVPAVGVSLGIERVFAIMEQLQKERNQTTRATETQVLVAIIGDNLSQAAELVSELWNAKLKAEFGVNKKVMKHISRAVDSRIPFVVIVGEHELNEGNVTLKYIETQVEEKVHRNEIIDKLLKEIEFRNF